MTLLVCPRNTAGGCDPPNHDIFHSSVSRINFCSSGVNRNNNDTAFIKWMA